MQEGIDPFPHEARRGHVLGGVSGVSLVARASVLFGAMLVTRNLAT